MSRVQGDPARHLAHRPPKLNQIEAAARLADLAGPGNNLEKLKDKVDGSYSIRINDTGGSSSASRTGKRPGCR